ncbi:hypothetical protein SFUMM280S_07111 [Streptomyces fumanus]
MLALAATTSGESASGSGTYAATPLSPSATWEAGGSSGAFTWSYPLEVPPAPGPSPDLSLAYDSGSVDGRTASTNNQTTPIGEGFNTSAHSYIERTYGSCDEDGQKDKFDLCWKFDNASLVLNGKSSELVKDDTTGTWRLKNDDASTVTLATGADNGDDNGEHWTVTTGDGTRYVFGLNKLPGAGTERTNSVWTVPVFGDDSGEPGYSQGGTFADRSLTQAWRWNLDYVEDLHDNAMSYWYTKETNSYAKNGASTATASYTRGGRLDKILYGQRADALFTGVTSGKVDFGYAERCTAADCSELTDSTAPNWPDVPFDAICAAGKDCPATGPAFFTRKRLTKIDTSVWSAATGAFTPVDTWELTQQYLDGGDIGDTTDQTLTLKSLRRTGRNGTDITLDPVTFTYDMRPNRVDGDRDDVLPLTRPRIRTVTTETGAITDVTLSGQECVRGSAMPAAEDRNTSSCYPQYWHVNGAEEASLDWFHKYRVTDVVTSDPTGHGATMESHYSYDGPAWHYNDSPFTPADERTWSVWRGYRTVTVTQGSGTDLSKKTSVYLQGMNGDRLLAADGTPDPDARRTATVPGKDLTGLDVPDQTDSEQYAGFLRQEITYNGATPITVTVNDPWSKRTATQHKSYADTEAYYVRTGRATAHTYLTATQKWRSAAVTTTYDDYGMAVKSDDTGDTARTGDETCTRTWYARNDSLGINSLTSRTRTVGRACSVAEADLSLPTSAATPGDVVTDTATVFDKADATAWTAAQTPTKGEATWNGRAAAYPAAVTGGERAPSSWATVSRITYDALGRPLTTTDPAGNPTTVTYTPADTGPLTRTQTKDANRYYSTYGDTTVALRTNESDTGARPPTWRATSTTPPRRPCTADTQALTKRYLTPSGTANAAAARRHLRRTTRGSSAGAPHTGTGTHPPRRPPSYDLASASSSASTRCCRPTSRRPSTATATPRRTRSPRRRHSARHGPGLRPAVRRGLPDPPRRHPRQRPPRRGRQAGVRLPEPDQPAVPGVHRRHRERRRRGRRPQRRRVRLLRRRGRRLLAEEGRPHRRRLQGLGLPVQGLPRGRRGLLRRHQQRPARRRVRRLDLGRRLLERGPRNRGLRLRQPVRHLGGQARVQRLQRRVPGALGAGRHLRAQRAAQGRERPGPPAQLQLRAVGQPALRQARPGRAGRQQGQGEGGRRGRQHAGVQGPQRPYALP